MVDTHLLTSAGLMLSMGSLADRVGRRAVLLAGFVVFIAGLKVSSVAMSNPAMQASALTKR